MSTGPNINRQSMKTTGLCGVMLLTLLSTAVRGGPSMPSMDRLEEESSLQTVFETPHTKWAKPYSLGTIRALFIVHLSTNRNLGPTYRVGELMRRYDIEAKAVLVATKKGTGDGVAYAGASGVYGGRLGEERLARLLKDDYDCFVVIGPVMDHIPGEVRANILDAVKRGAGLVMRVEADERDKSILEMAKELKELPAMLADLEARTFELGKGRLVCFSQAGWSIYLDKPQEVFALAPFFGLDMHRDIRLERMGRPVLWAARREPPLNVAIDVADHALDRSELSQRRIKVTWRGKDVPGPLSVAARIRCQFLDTTELPVAQGVEAAAGEKSYALPALPAGTYWVDAVASSKRGVEGWAVNSFTVTTGDSLDLKLQREWGESGDEIRGSVAVATAREDDKTLRVRAIDRHGRVLVQEDFPRPTQDVEFRLPTYAWMPGALGLDAVLLKGDHEVCHAFARYTIPRRKRDDWNFVLWGRLYNFEADDAVEDYLAASGVTARTETSRHEWWYMTRAGMAYMPMISVGLSRHRWDEHRRRLEFLPLEQTVATDGRRYWERIEGCWNAEPAASDRLRRWASEQKKWVPYSVLAYNMGDERATTGMCLRPACWKTYLGYLEGQYANIDALNESWGTSFSSFDRIEPIIDGTSLPAKPAEERRAAQMMWANQEASSKGPTRGSTSWNERMRSYPRWFDRQAFGPWNFCNHVGRVRKALSKGDPHAQVGLEGTGYIDDDIDWYVRNTDWWMYYSTLPIEVVRSIAPKIAPGHRFGQWTGGRNFWTTFCRGANRLGQWRVDNILGPAYAPNAESARMIQTARVIFDGMGRLLNIESRMQHDGIVMLHSFPSAAAANFLEAGRSYGDYNGMVSNLDDHMRPDENLDVDWTLTADLPHNHLVWHSMIRAAGLQFEYVTDRMLRRGEFDPAPYKVFILSQCEAIGPTEARIVREFVAAGGTVIADIRPGLYDSQCKPLAAGALDDVFGVSHTGNVEALESNGAIRGTIGVRDVAVDLRRIHVNPAVQLRGATALGSAGPTPICIVNSFGKGRAILLNFAMWSYPNVWSPKAPRGALELLRSAFASAGVEWPLRLVDDGGKPYRQVEAVRWKTGPGTEVVIIRGPLEERYANPIPGISQLLAEADTPLPVVDKSPPVHVRLPEPRYVVDIATGGREGPVTRFTTENGMWWPAIIVLSDRPLQAPVLTAAEKTVVRGGMIRLQVDIPDARGLHAVKVRAKTPGGKEAPWFSRSVIVKDGTAQISLPIALSEKRGRWTVTATDLYTGDHDEASFLVE